MTATKEVTCITMIVTNYIPSIHIHPLRPHTIHQYSLEYNVSTTNRKLSSHSKDCTLFQSSAIYCWRVKIKKQPKVSSPVIQLHLFPDILACSDRWKVNSGSFETWFNGEYDRPFGITPIPIAWPSFNPTHYQFPLRIHLILPISACSSSRKAMSGVLESPHCALSIGCSSKA